jgi:hypothetical protein
MNSSQAIERACAVIRRQHKTIATERIYLLWLRHFLASLGEMAKILPTLTLR